MHRLFADGEIDQMGMLRLCHELGIEGFEFVNRFFPSPQYQYLLRLRETAEELGIRLLLIMCDGEGDMAAPDQAERLQAARNHHKWIDIARVLGCHSIRCNVRGDESDVDAMRERAAESFGGLLAYADAAGVDVVVENHGGPSSDPDWLVSLVQAVDHSRFGTLPDFGNFPPDIDRYDAVATLMPHAKGVSAKCYDFDPDGNESTIDFARMLGIVRDAGYRGFVGIEYEGRNLPEREGIASALQLLRRTI
jgi:sugar phosphate isomerase/epimerase